VAVGRYQLTGWGYWKLRVAVSVIVWLKDCVDEVAVKLGLEFSMWLRMRGENEVAVRCGE
jgi:hypothetical protein